MSTLAARAMPRRSRWIPWVFVGGFLLVVAVNAALIFFSVNSFTGLTTTEAYTKGLRFNDQIREAEVYERLGWHVAARFSPVEGRSGTIEVKLTDRNGAALTGAEVSVEFSRPVEKDRDFTLTSAPVSAAPLRSVSFTSIVPRRASTGLKRAATCQPSRS
jgi:nitrogen fixation protein FixH